MKVVGDQGKRKADRLRHLRSLHEILGLPLLARQRIADLDSAAPVHVMDNARAYGQYAER